MEMEVGDDGAAGPSWLGYYKHQTASCKCNTCHARLTCTRIWHAHSLRTGARQRCACVFLVVIIMCTLSCWPVTESTSPCALQCSWPKTLDSTRERCWHGVGILCLLFTLLAPCTVCRRTLWSCVLTLTQMYLHAELPCQNRRTCNVRPGTCTCPPGVTGNDCSTKMIFKPSSKATELDQNGLQALILFENTLFKSPLHI